MTQELRHHFYNGRAVEGKSGRFGDVYNPNTGEIQARVAFSSSSEVRAAVEGAKSAFSIWSATNPQRRARVMFKFKELLEQNMDGLAHTLSMEHGKVIADAKGEDELVY